MVVEFVVGAKAFALCAAADASGDEEFLAGHIIPDAGDGLLVGVVACQGCHVGDATVEVACAYGMAYDLLLLEDGHVVLAVHAGLVAVGAASGLLDEVFGLVKIFLVARYLI